ncbi:MAG TPA: hemolysin family protein [Anaerolineae bacterium]|nr:hemolysin family protein [Anaerolineae bacterium]HOQ97552.1 hemolysin family protein [Anaerolineae bacterium]HPL30030.1 hemolysin family protein [Anaerolineae bacterium]
MSLQIVIILLLIAANGLFAGIEMAVVSSRRSRLEAQAEEGDRNAQAALDLIEAPSTFLSTIQIGITLVGTLAGAIGGAALATRLAPALAQLPGVAPYAQTIAVAVVVIGITYLTLVLGELVPKRIALIHPESIARASAPFMRSLAGAARPIVWVLSGSTDLVLWLTGQRAVEPPPASEEEIKYLMAEGARVGVFAGTERELVERVFRFADTRVRELMQPRSEVVAIDVELPADEVRQLVLSATYSRFPVYRDNLDNILGIAHARDILVQGDEIDLGKILRQPLFVPESQLISATLRAFQVTHSHIAIVINEYGETEGLVTLEDVLEQLVGEIEDEYDRVEQSIVRRADGSLLVDGMLPADELRELLGVEQLPGEEHYQFNTLAGFVMAQLGRLPRVADYIIADGHRFEVIDMDGRRIDRVLVAPAQPPQPAEQQKPAT